MEPRTELQPVESLLQQDRPPVLVVVGAGVSIGATRASAASWQGLLLDGLETVVARGIRTPEEIAPERDLVRLSFARSPFPMGEVLRRAEALIEHFGGASDPRFARWLADSVGSLRAGPGSDGTLRAIADLHDGGALVLTTNYDDLVSHACQAPPVTWLDANEFLRVMRREKRGVLHIHGHWRQPESVVLGLGTYDRIRNSEPLQMLFRDLWLERTWLYVGCGDGLDDPNFGPLLAWGIEKFGPSALTSYLLARQPASASGPAPNVKVVPYQEHAELPEILSGLTPIGRCFPFVRLGPNADCNAIRNSAQPPLDSPLASWEEYRAGLVPRSMLAARMHDRLEEHGWAFVLDAASVGKTTAALVMATHGDQDPNLIFYLTLKDVSESDADASSKCLMIARRLARPGILLIVDDVNHHPALARKVLEQWRDRSGGSRLLLIGTRGHRAAAPAAASAMAALQSEPANPVIMARPKKADVRGIFAFLMARLAPETTLPEPPSDVLERWHRDFGCELAAFAAAVTERRTAILAGDWSLPIEAAAAWMRDHHLLRLEPEALQNAACLAAFASQDLELEVPRPALPHPETPYVAPLLARGIVRETRHPGGTPDSYGLHESGWGALILSALRPSPDATRLVHEAAACSASLALNTSDHLQRAREVGRDRALWHFLADDSRRDAVRTSAMGLSLPELRAWLARAGTHEPSLANEVWDSLERAPDLLLERARATELPNVGEWIALAHTRNRAPLADGMWKALVADSSFVEGQLRALPLDEWRSLVVLGERRGDAVFLDRTWSILLDEPAMLTRKVRDLPLQRFGDFFDLAVEAGHPEALEAVWKELLANPGERVADALRAELWATGAFSDAARRHGFADRLAPFWAELRARKSDLTAALDRQPIRTLGYLMHVFATEKQDELLDATSTHLASDLPGTGRRLAGARPREIAGFLDSAPPVLAYTLAAGFDERRLMQFARSPGQCAPVGLARLADHLIDLDREDLGREMIRILLERADRGDFPPRHGGIHEVAILLSCALDQFPDEEPPALRRFVANVVSPTWLGAGYSTDECGHLAGALSRIATRQAPDIARRFLHPLLGMRIGRELALPARVDRDSAARLSLLGAADHLGVAMRPAWFDRLDPAPLAAIPEHVLPTEPDADDVRFYQRQMWMGLRVLARYVPVDILVSPVQLARTLHGWRAARLESESKLVSPLRALDRAMVQWLEACVENGGGRLARDTRPLAQLFSEDTGPPTANVATTRPPRRGSRGRRTGKRTTSSSDASPETSGDA